MGPKRFAAIAALSILLVILPGCGRRHAESYSGWWAEKISERVVASFSPCDGGFSVEIGWREDGLAQYGRWSMTAVPDGKGGLDYRDGRYLLRTLEHEGDTVYTEETVYVDGTGRFFINPDGNLVWTDGKDPEGEPSVFIKVDPDRAAGLSIH